MKKNYVKIVDETLLKLLDIDDSDIVEILNQTTRGYDNTKIYNVITKSNKQLMVVAGQYKPLGNSLRERILSAGIENCFFYGDYYDHGKFLMNIDEARHKVIDNYKITLKKVDSQESFHHFYVSDLDSMIESGQILFLIKAPQK
jgi:hypothetical protein